MLPAVIEASRILLQDERTSTLQALVPLLGRCLKAPDIPGGLQTSIMEVILSIKAVGSPPVRGALVEFGTQLMLSNISGDFQLFSQIHERVLQMVTEDVEVCISTLEWSPSV